MLVLQFTKLTIGQHFLNFECWKFSRINQISRKTRKAAGTAENPAHQQIILGGIQINIKYMYYL